MSGWICKVLVSEEIGVYLTGNGSLQILFNKLGVSQMNQHLIFSRENVAFQFMVIHEAYA